MVSLNKTLARPSKRPGEFAFAWDGFRSYNRPCKMFPLPASTLRSHRFQVTTKSTCFDWTGRSCMATSNERGTNQKIVIQKNGPYVVRGDVPLVRKTQVVSEYGEPMTWQKGETLETGETYELCRCGKSSHKPFCDD